MILRLTLYVAFTISLVACGNIELNRNIEIADGTRHKDDITAVNGSITVGKDCEIQGSCQSINGNVEIGAGSVVRDVSSVNGRIFIDKDVRVKGDVNSINGELTIKSGSVISRSIDVLNQNIKISGTEVGGDITIKNGDIILRDQTTVNGNIFINTESILEIEGSQRQSAIVEISGGSVVKGDIDVGDRSIEVKVRLVDGGKVLGDVLNAEIIDRDM